MIKSKKYTSRTELFEDIKAHCVNKAELGAQTIEKLNALFESISNAAVESVVLGAITSSSLDRMMNDVNKWSPEELQEFVMKKYGNKE